EGSKRTADRNISLAASKRFFQNTRDLHSQLFYLPERYLSTRQVLTLWISLFVLPVWTNLIHRRALWFSAALAVLGPLPIAFLHLRWFYVMYVPMIRWAIYFATLLVIARDGIVRELRRVQAIYKGPDQKTRLRRARRTISASRR
ncbi:MAG: hypothetical protein QOJ99_770, partial [Bryobacterales bacterium]|nr:hypothetical protein [Bryobacterales bacterium]